MMPHLNPAQLLDYLDATLSPSEHERVELHLRDCAECTALVADQRLAFTALNTLTDAPVTRDFSASVVAQVKLQAHVRQPQPIAPLTPLWRVALAVQGLIAGVVLVIAAPLSLSTISTVTINDLTTQWLNGFTLALTEQVVALQEAWHALVEPAMFTFSLDLTGPTLLWVVALGAAMALWVLGNGVLLRGWARPTLSERNHS